MKAFIVYQLLNLHKKCCFQLTVKELNDALVSMHKKSQFAQMVLYIEACESGSMFKNKLPNNINGTRDPDSKC